MTKLDDLPAAAVRLITRAARTRRIPGTNRFAQVARSWRDADLDSGDQEQLQLLLPLEGLPADSLTSTSEWLSQHGACVTQLNVSYNPTLFQQLPLSSAPLVNLARLEVDGPDSLVALAPALPQLVALTHLRASIELGYWDGSTHTWSQGVFIAAGVPLEAPPCLQQLCPGLKSLHLDIVRSYPGPFKRVEAPLAQLLPDRLEQLQITNGGGKRRDLVVCCRALTPFSSLQRLSITCACVAYPDEVLRMPGLEQLDMWDTFCWVDDSGRLREHRKVLEHYSVPQNLSKLVRLDAGCLGSEPIMPPMANALCGLRKLDVIWWHPSAAAGVQQQLSGLSGLQHLSLAIHSVTSDAVQAVVLSLSSVQQLTYLLLWSDHQLVPRSTWAAVLPHLSQLRVLAVRMELLGSGLAAELPQLRQLQCLYVLCDSVKWESAAIEADMAPHLLVLSTCNSLKAVLCWSYPTAGAGAGPLCEVVHGGRFHLSGWHKWYRAAIEGRVVCPRPCPHLPGVWELQQEV